MTSFLCAKKVPFDLMYGVYFHGMHEQSIEIGGRVYLGGGTIFEIFSVLYKGRV